MSQDTTGSFRSKINSVIGDLEQNFGTKTASGDMDFTDTDISRIQKFIENINTDVNPMSDKAGAQVSGKTSQVLRGILDKKIEGATGEGYQALRSQYADIKSIEDNLINQFKKSSRGIGKGVGDWVEGFGSLDTVVGLLTSNPATMAKGAGMFALGKYMKKFRDPEAKLQNIFKAIEKQQNRASEFVPKSKTLQYMKGKGGMSIKEVPNALENAIAETERNIRTLKSRGLSEKSSQMKTLIKQLDQLRKK
jgi:archaellum component FlaC